MSPARLHVVALAHLDTQWRWTVRDTVRHHLPDTVAANEALFERFPRYVLSFEGAHRYRLLEEHHPRLFETVCQRVEQRRWSPAGAAVEAFDTLLPAPESIVRQIVLGRRWFRDRLGVDSRDLFLPDCFGFPATLPTLAGHAGVVGFSTQKLRRGEVLRSAHGIPFAYGRWRGPDGSELLAALDPGEYSGRIERELERDALWLERFAALEANAIPPRLLFYVGTGDRGGAVPAATVANLERALSAAGPIEVAHGSSEQIFLATSANERSRLPVYEGELLLRVHGTGCYAAKAILKRWNREVERLAFAAEAAAALASSSGHAPPRDRIERAWWRLLAHQMHDDLTGTSIPAAYRFSLDDLGLAANELAEALVDAVSRQARELSRPAGAFLLFSPLGTPRTELVEIELAAGEAPVRATGPAGEPRACQLVERDGRRCALVAARFDGVELQVVDLHANGAAAAAPASELAVERDRLENGRYRARFDARGRLASLFDKQLGRELLAAPLELELLANRSRKYPAWEIRWRDLSAPPRERIEELVASEVLEHGPLRAALRFEQRARGAVARATWSLGATGTDDWLALELELDWRRSGWLLELRFPFSAGNDRARYDTGLGAIARPAATEALYEVPAQGWAALEDTTGDFGAAVLADVPRGWNQPDRSTLRATLLHAPAAGRKFRHQATHDFGRHRWRFALVGLERGAIDSGELARLSDRFRNPPIAFRAEPGGFEQAPRRATLLSLAPPTRLLALAPAANGGNVLARLSNPAAQAEVPRLELDASVEIVRETDALGDPPGHAGDSDPQPLRALPPSGLRTLELRFPEAAPPAPDGYRSLDLPWTVHGFGRQSDPARDGGFDGSGVRFPLERMPARLDDSPVPFDLCHLGSGADTALADGGALEFEAGAEELWLLAASAGGAFRALFSIAGRDLAVELPGWREPLLVESRWRTVLGFGKVAEGRFRRVPVSWTSGHLHDRRGDDLPVERASLFALRLPLHGAARIVLPRDPRLRVVAATLARRPARIAAEAFAWPPP